MTEYIIQVKNRSIGNSALWWSKGSKGYTTDPYDAEIFSEDQAITIARSTHYDVIVWNKAEVLHLAQHHVDVGKLVESRMNKDPVL